MPKIELLNCDCMEYMATLPDKAFDLAIVDPPYGIGFDGEVTAMANNNSMKWNNSIGSGYKRKDWDTKKPDEIYFHEIMRISKNQIIWGGNYFDLPPTRCYIFWDKMVQVENFADGELAWTSFDKNAKQFRYAWGGLSDGVLGRNKKEKSIHPTQKPTALYDWLLMNYANEGDLILDTHLGSGSSRIAAYKGGFNFVGFEIDCDYFNAQEKRFNEFKSQLRLF